MRRLCGRTTRRWGGWRMVGVDELGRVRVGGIVVWVVHV